MNWLLIGLGIIYGLVGLLVARLLPIAVSRSFPATARWYERLPALATGLIHVMGGLLWPLVAVGFGLALLLGAER